MKMNKFEINERPIGPDEPPYIIAELSGNHNGELSRAIQTIDMAKAMGADAIKFQTYTADTLTIDSNKEDFQIHGGLWDGYNLYNLYQSAHTPFEWHKSLFDHAHKIGITCFSTPFDETAVDLLEDLNAPAYKIASFEIVDLPLIKYVASTGKPMIISTGMANLEEIYEAVETARVNGCQDIILLHCISGYPAPIEQSNLRTIPDLAKQFNVVTGLSDHTLGTSVAVASVALGACLIEKHVTLSREDKGPDSEFSLEPSELHRLCLDTRSAWSALGKAGYERKPVEEASIKFRRSVYVVKDIKKGDVFSKDNIRSIRPGYGLAPKYIENILGKSAVCDLEHGTALQWKYIV
jgi:pseudaminic acid synthase